MGFNCTNIRTYEVVFRCLGLVFFLCFPVVRARFCLMYDAWCFCGSMLVYMYSILVKKTNTDIVPSASGFAGLEDSQDFFGYIMV